MADHDIPERLKLPPSPQWVGDACGALRAALAVLQGKTGASRGTWDERRQWHQDRRAAIAKIEGVLADEEAQ